MSLLSCSLPAKCCYLSCSRPDWRPWSYQSVAIYCVPIPIGALGVAKVLLLIVFPTQLAPSDLPKSRYLSCYPPGWRFRNYQSIAIYCVPNPIAKVLLLIVFPTRLAPSDLPKCRYLSCYPPSWRFRSYQSVAVPNPTDALGVTKMSRVPRPSCGLRVTKVSLFIVFPFPHLALPKCHCFHGTDPTGVLGVTTLFVVLPTRLAPSELPKCCYSLCSPPDWRPRS